jgi:glycosyltransferase involved in cell wall biosynthesis
MKRHGLVSVIMPVYNGMPLIKASIQSLLNQSYENWECIIVNDGSTDGTKEFLDSLKNKRFVIHHFNKNLGRPQARQKGLDLSKGEFLAMLDADDLYHPEKLSLQVNVMNRNPDVYLVGSGICSFGTNVDFIRIRSKGDGNVRNFHINEEFPSSHAPSILRREHAIKFKYNPALKLGQDIDYLRRYLDGKKYINLPNVFYYYSEFDSVTKSKIRRTYKIYIKKFFAAKEYKMSVFYLLKLLYSYLIYSFMNINTILKKRGNLPLNEEFNDYKNYCVPIIINLNQSK